jgi:hypothetical protein
VEPGSATGSLSGFADLNVEISGLVFPNPIPSLSKEQQFVNADLWRDFAKVFETYLPQKFLQFLELILSPTQIRECGTQIKHIAPHWKMYYCRAH